MARRGAFIMALIWATSSATALRARSVAACSAASLAAAAAFSWLLQRRLFAWLLQLSTPARPGAAAAAALAAAALRFFFSFLLGGSFSFGGGFGLGCFVRFQLGQTLLLLAQFRFLTCDQFRLLACFFFAACDFRRVDHRRGAAAGGGQRFVALDEGTRS
jgi:hypothetical protein